VRRHFGVVGCAASRRHREANVVADPADLVRAWRDAVQQLRDVAAPNLDELTLSKLIAPLQRQAEIFEQALRRQAEFDAQLGRRLLAPMESFVEVVDQTPAAVRAQAQAFEAAALSFKQAAEVLEAQAAMMEQAIKTMTLPTDLLKSIGGLTDSEATAEAPKANKPTRRR
jgi:hypothetical protein